MKEEVDEANSEDKDKAETSAESKDTAASKGTDGLSHMEHVFLHLDAVGNQFKVISNTFTVTQIL